MLLGRGEEGSSNDDMMEQIYRKTAVGTTKEGWVALVCKKLARNGPEAAHWSSATSRI
jgi:hypothetical protein